MATNNTQSLKPFRQHAETDVVNLFSLEDDDADVMASYLGFKADGAKINKGLLVSVKGGGWKNTDDPVDKLGLGGDGSITPGKAFDNTTSFRYGTAAKVEPFKKGEEPLGITLWDVAEVDENGEKLLYHPRKAAEMQAVISGQAVPVLTKGIVLYSGKLTSDGSIVAGDPIYADNAQGGQLHKDATNDSAAAPRVGTALGSIDDNGFMLIKLDL
jgi:hypothetical protein